LRPAAGRFGQPGGFAKQRPVSKKKAKRTMLFFWLRLQTNRLFSMCPQGSNFHFFHAGWPAHSSTEAEDNVHRMEGWAKRAPLTTCSAKKRKTRGKTGGTSLTSSKHPDVCPLPASRFGADIIHFFAGRQESERARSPMRHGLCLHAESQKNNAVLLALLSLHAIFASLLLSAGSRLSQTLTTQQRSRPCACRCRRSARRFRPAR